MAKKAKEKASEIIATHYPQPLSDEQIREIETVRRWIEAGVPSDKEAIIAAQTKEETARFEELVLSILRDEVFLLNDPASRLGSE